MTVAEYQQAQNDIAEIKAQIAQLRDVVAKGVPAVREIYGADLPTPEPLPEAGASYPNVGALQFQQGKMMAGVEAAKKAVMPTTEALGAIRGNPEEQGTIENIARGGAALIATAPAMLPLTVEQSVAGGVERGNPLAPATDMAQAIGQTFQRQVTGEAGGVTRGEAWSKTPVEEAFNLATPLLAGLGIAKARTPKIKSIKEARAAINDIGKPKVDVPEVVQEPIRSETPKLEQPTSAAEVVGKAEPKPTTDWAYDAKKTSRSKGWTLTPERFAEIEKGFEKRRREWIDKERETNPDFAPDIESKKELLTPEQLAEVNRYEELMHKATSLERANGYKPTKLSKAEQAEYSNLGKKYQDIFYSRAKQPTTATEVVAKAKPNLVTGNVKQLTPDELTAAQAINLDNLLGGKISQQAPIATKKRGTSTYDGIGVGDIVVQNREGYTVKVDKLYENGKGEFTVIDAPDGHPWKNELNQGRTVRSSFHQPVTKNFTKLTPSDAPATATEVVAKTNTSTLRDALGKMLVKDAIATKDAEIGTNILLDMSERGFSPQKVHEEFINNVYDRLPEDIRAKFNRLIEKQTGEKVGQYWKDYKTMAKELIDLGDDAEMLEGTERGFAVMEAEAVKRFSGEGVPLIGENLKQPTAEEHGIRRPIRNKQILDAVNEKIKNGGDVILSTHTKHTRITKPEHLRVNSAGELQIVRGKNWDTVTEQYAENLAEQAGLERAKSLLDNLPEIDYASIPLQESHYLFLERGGKKYPVAGPYPDAAALEADRPRIESLLEKADPTSHFDTRVYGKTGSVEAQLAYAKRIDQLKTMEGYEPTATVQDAAVRPAQPTNPVVTAKETEYDAFLKRHEQARADAKIQAEAEMARKAEQDAIAKANEEARQARLDASAKERTPQVPKIIADAVTPKKAASVVKQEAQTTALTDKSFKTQMKSEIEAALRDAPDRPQELQDMIDSYNYADEKRGGMSWERKEESLKAQRENINDLRKKLDIKTVTIEIPDDGTFTVEHTKQALQELNKRLGQNIETKVRKETSTPRGGDRGLQEATIGGYNVQVFGDQSSIRPSGTKGISTIKVDYRNDPVLKKLGVVSNDHYLIEESALTKHPKQILIKDKALDEAKTKEFISGLDKIKFDDNSANEIVTYNDGLNNKVIFDNGELSVGFSGEYIEFFKSNVKNFSLRLSGETTPAAIMSGDKRVGVLMPLRTEGQIAITRPTPTELHAGVNPFKIIDDYMTKRKLVNPLGTPEHVLSGKGIVEPFRKAQEAIRNETKARGESLQETLKGIQRGSHEDNALYHRLDDPTAVLNEQEQAVRNYLDDLLTEVNKHREARGQEPVKRRKGYITHLVEEVEKQSREYGDTPMPKRFKFQFELAREGNASHKVSAIEALEVYTKAALKDIYIGDALAETVPKIEAMGDRPLIFKKSVTSEDGKVTNQSFYQFSDAPIITERGYAEAFIKGQMNVPTVGQRALETAFDIKPNTSQHAAMAITARFYQSLLGLAVDSGVKNLTQGINTMAEMGVVPTLKGYAKLATGKGLKSARAEHLLEDFNPLLMEGADLPFKTKTARAIGKGFSATLNAPMKVAEFINRGAAFHAAYDVFIKKGMSLEQAHEAARAAVRKTQFSYSKIDTSPALRGPFARTFSQFFSYPLKQSEMMYKWATKPGEQGKLIRYFLYTGMAVVGAKYAGVDMSGVFFDPIKMVDPNSKEGFQLPGSDKRVTIDPKKLGKSGYTPQGFAPSISIPYDFVKSQMSDDESTRAYGRTKALTSITPGGRYGKKVYDVITESDEKGKRDRLTRENTDKDKTLKLLGFRGTEREAESSRREKTAEVEKKYYATRQKLIDLKISGNEDEFVKVRDEFRDKYPFLYGRLMKGFGDAVKEERKKKGMTTDERFFDNSLRKQIDANL